MSFRENLEAPIEKGEIIGTATYSLENEVLKTINLVSDSSVKRLNLLNLTTNVYGNWFKMLR